MGTSPHRMDWWCHWLYAGQPSLQINAAHGGLPVAHHTTADSIATIHCRVCFGLGDVGWCRWADALDRGTRMVPGVPRVAGVPATLGCAEEHPLRGTGRFFAAGGSMVSSQFVCHCRTDPVYLRKRTVRRALRFQPTP